MNANSAGARNVADHAQLRLVGGEMPEWTDHRAERPAAGGAALVELVREQAPAVRHAVVVGPHAHEVSDLVVERCEHTTFVVRGHVDAVMLAERYSGRSVEVLCGDLAAAQISDVDLVVALDGVGRVTSLNVAHRTDAEAWQLVVAMAGAAAGLLLGLASPLHEGGPGRAAPEVSDDDAAWRPWAGADDTAPASAQDVQHLLGSLADGALVWSSRGYAHRPTLLVAPHCRMNEAWEVAAQPRARGAEDRRWTAAVHARHGRSEDLASGWVVVRSSTGSAASDVVAIADRAGTASSCRDTLPVGALLETVLLEACARRDQPAVHALVAQWAEALARSGDVALWSDPVADSVVVGPDGSLDVLSVPGQVADSVEDRERVFDRVVADFALRLSDLGWRHPWPVAAGPNEIAQLLVASTGRTLSAEAAAAAVAAAEEASSRAGRLLLVAEDPVADRLVAENTALRSKVSWFEAAIRQRERALSDLRNRVRDPAPRLTRRVRALEEELAQVRGSVSFRAGQAIVAPAKRARALLKR